MHTFKGYMVVFVLYVYSSPVYVHILHACQIIWKDTWDKNGKLADGSQLLGAWMYKDRQASCKHASFSSYISPSNIFYSFSLKRNETENPREKFLKQDDNAYKMCFDNFISALLPVQFNQDKRLWYDLHAL